MDYEMLKIYNYPAVLLCLSMIFWVGYMFIRDFGIGIWKSTTK